VEGISFSQLGDYHGDSGTFLNIFMPDTETAQRTIEEFNKAGVAGFNYWFTNMYHFINQWEHIKGLKTASKLGVEVIGMPQDYTNLHLPNTQAIVGRLISFAVRCTWTEDEMKSLATKISECAVKAMKPVNA
jgi:8-amino-3,8-dideoxy-alpha-D-manno-octulosonate transaminase